MATSLKGFWLIVGMTAAAFAIATATSDKHGSSSYTVSSGYDNASSKPVMPSQPTRSSPTKSQATPSTAPASVPTPPPIDDVISIAVNRSIDQDIRSAFEDAVKVALATPDVRVTEPQESEDDEVDSPLTLSPLETRDVSSLPKVFDEPGSTVGQPSDASRELVRTTTDLNLREGPDPAYLKVETLADGTVLVVLEKNGKWWRVRSIASGAEGWVNGTFLKPTD